MSGRKRWRVTIPLVAASTASTRRTGTRRHSFTACAVTPTAFARADGPPTTRIACSSAVSLFLGMDPLNHCFSPRVKYCLNLLKRKDNSGVPDRKKSAEAETPAEKLAKRIRVAMDSHEPKITLTQAATACSVTVQAVHGWRANGRIAKRHLLTLADLTGKDATYFLSVETLPRDGAQTHQNEFQTLQRAWDTATQDQREILLGVARGILNARRGKRSSTP